jgi:hypothetical protein
MNIGIILAVLGVGAAIAVKKMVPANPYNTRLHVYGNGQVDIKALQAGLAKYRIGVTDKRKVGSQNWYPDQEVEAQRLMKDPLPPTMLIVLAPASDKNGDMEVLEPLANVGEALVAKDARRQMPVMVVLAVPGSPLQKGLHQTIREWYKVNKGDGVFQNKLKGAVTKRDGAGAFVITPSLLLSIASA